MPITLEFRGRWLNIYGNLILIAIFSGVTAGIYLPWGYARWQRIITENTYFEDEQLEFDGSGAGAFVQFIVIGFFTLITLGLYVILGFSSTRMLRWQYAHTLTPNGLRMEYEGRSLDVFWEWFLLVLLTPLTLGLYYYWGRNRLRRQILTHVSLSDQPMQLGSTPGENFVAVLSNWVMTVVAIVLYAALGFFLRSAVLDSGPLMEQLGSIGGGLPIMDLVNVLLIVVALGVYALVGLGLLGLATVRFRSWEVNRTLLTAPVPSRSPMSVMSTPTGALTGAPPPFSETVDTAPQERGTSFPEDEPAPFPGPVGEPPARPLPVTHPEDDDEYYDFAEFSSAAGQEPETNSGDERTDWSSEQWARPQASSLLPDEEEDDGEAGQRDRSGGDETLGSAPRR